MRLVGAAVDGAGLRGVKVGGMKERNVWKQVQREVPSQVLALRSGAIGAKA